MKIRSISTFVLAVSGAALVALGVYAFAADGSMPVALLLAAPFLVATHLALRQRRQIR